MDICRELYNAALSERRQAWQRQRKSITYLDQQNVLPEIKQVREDVAEIHSQVLQDVLRRLDKAFKAFFARVKKGEKAGFRVFAVAIATIALPLLKVDSRCRKTSFSFLNSVFSKLNGIAKLSAKLKL